MQERGLSAASGRIATRVARALAAASLAATTSVTAVDAQAISRPGQTPTMPSTLRYGSGLLDIPVSSVLPHLQSTATYSGFWVGLDRTALVDGNGAMVGFGPAASSYHWDGSAAVGLFDRGEAGLALQSLGGPESGGDVWGLFGRVRLWEPIDQGIGLAVGARYLTSPDFPDGSRYAAGRLGFTDPRLAKSYTGGTNLTAYGVATAYVRGYDAGGRLWENDMTFTLGYGGGMFKSGASLPFYGEGSGNGWFYGASVNMRTTPASMLTLMAEHNGFDVNIGAQYDWEGWRAGVHWLASNHAEPTGGHFSEYQKGKVGFVVSVAVCPGHRNLRCRPQMMRRVEPDTIVLPAPPPDTVMVGTVAEGPPPGDDVEICLSTGQNIPVRLTAAGDTLVGPDYASLRSLRPALTFAGGYAAGAFWYDGNAVVTFEGADFGRSGEPFPLDCNQILRVGVHNGVPVFADRAAERPLVILFIPVRPGVWARYERGIR